MKQEYAFSERQSPATGTRRSDEPLRTRLEQLAWEKPGFGYRRWVFWIRMLSLALVQPKSEPQQNAVVFLRERKQVPSEPETSSWLQIGTLTGETAQVSSTALSATCAPPPVA